MDNGVVSALGTGKGLVGGDRGESLVPGTRGYNARGRGLSESKMNKSVHPCNLRGNDTCAGTCVRWRVSDESGAEYGCVPSSGDRSGTVLSVQFSFRTAKPSSLSIGHGKEEWCEE